MGTIFQEKGLIDQCRQIYDSGFLLRLDFGYHNAEHTSVYASFALFVTLIFGKRILGLISEPGRWVVWCLIALLSGFSVFVVLVAQTRATWIALATTSGVAIIVFFWCRIKKTGWSGIFRDHITMFGFVIVVLTILMLLFNSGARDLVEKRLGKEKDVVEKVFSGDLEDIRMSSLGKRLAVWRNSVDWIKERPLTGWGPQARKELVDNSDLPEMVKKKMRHVHNSYIELLVAYGFIGLGLFAGIFFYVWYCGWKAWRAGVMPSDVMLFALLWTVYWLIVNTTESYVIYTATGQYVDAIVAGVMYTYHLKQVKASKISA